MAILRVVWATHYLRWVAIFGVTAGAHVAAFCLYVAGGGQGGGPAVPAGRVTLYLARAELPCETPLMPVCPTDPPAEVRSSPVESDVFHRSPGQLPPVSVTTKQRAEEEAPMACALPQARRPEARAVASSALAVDRMAGAAPREIDQPIALGEGLLPPRVVPVAKGHAGDGCSTAAAPIASRSREATGTAGARSGDAEGVEADFALSGKPLYPIECRRGDCNGHAPCQGCSRWRVTVPAPGGKPTRLECLRSAGCARLDTSVERFLHDTRIPRVGVFVLQFRFRLDGR